MCDDTKNEGRMETQGEQALLKTIKVAEPFSWQNSPPQGKGIRDILTPGQVCNFEANWT